MKASLLLFCCTFAVLMAVSYCNDKVDQEGEDVEVDPEKLEYTKGSLCKYCDYCKFCKLCDEQCPCETGPGKPACNMCKYCKFCYLCSPVCDTVCKPGGLVDRVSGAVINALPSVDFGQVDSELDSHKAHIDKKKQEL